MVRAWRQCGMCYGYSNPILPHALIRELNRGRDWRSSDLARTPHSILYYHGESKYAKRPSNASSYPISAGSVIQDHVLEFSMGKICY